MLQLNKTMAKYSKKIVKRICDLIRKDSYTIVELCSLSGISKETYYQWLDTKPDFSDEITKAHDDFDEMLVAEAKKSLIKKIKGYTVQETKTVWEDSGRPGIDGKITPKIKEKTIIDKTFQPDATSIIFALTNKASDEYRNRQSSELTGKDGKDLIPDGALSGLSTDELKQLHTLLAKASAKK